MNVFISIGIALITMSASTLLWAVDHRNDVGFLIAWIGMMVLGMLLVFAGNKKRREEIDADKKALGKQAEEISGLREDIKAMRKQIEDAYR